MVEKVFWEEPYRTALETRVAAVAGDEVTLEATILYALSGGQESDRGTIGGREVRAARLDGQEIFYRLDPDHGLRAGEPVALALDWPRRYRLMRLHFAAEIVLELFTRNHPGGDKTGAHIAEEKARIDFAWPSSVAPLLPPLEEEARAIVAADLPIESAFSDRAAGRRYWKIDGFARVPCGGTHLRRTGEVGGLSLRRRNPGRGMERIEITVADLPGH